MTNIQDIKQRVKIEEVLGRYHPLAGKPTDMRALDEPALSVNSVKGVYCRFDRAGKSGGPDGGDMFDWLQRYQNMTFEEALQAIALTFGIDIGRRTPIRSLSSLPNEPAPTIVKPDEPVKPAKPVTWEEVWFYHEQLWAHEEGVKWFVDRGFTLDSISKFAFGYEPDFCGFGPASMIPVFEHGEPAALRVRFWKPTPKIGKYRNIRAGLGSHLYNGDILEAVPEEVFVVEGELKAASFIQAGLPNFIGIQGKTVASTLQNRVKDKTRVYVWFDPDVYEDGRIPPTWPGEMAHRCDVRAIVSPAKPDDAIVGLKPSQVLDYVRSLARSSRIVRRVKMLEVPKEQKPVQAQRAPEVPF